MYKIISTSLYALFMLALTPNLPLLLQVWFPLVLNIFVTIALKALLHLISGLVTGRLGCPSFACLFYFSV